MRRVLWVAGAVALALRVSAAPAFAAPDDRCYVDQPTLTGNVALPHTRAALIQHHLKIVAIGSSSTQGWGSTAPDKAYPAQLQALLSQLYPNVEIEVVNKGIGGEEAVQMLARFDRDVAAQNADLVIWQTGTNAALLKVPMDVFHDALREGFHKLSVYGDDALLMTPQYAPRYFEAPNAQGYLDALGQEAQKAEVPVFQRFDASKVWYSDPAFSGPLVTKDGLHQTDAGYRCDAFLLSQDMAQALDSPMPAVHDRQPKVAVDNSHPDLVSHAAFKPAAEATPKARPLP